jgi:hypothetical protein
VSRCRLEAENLLLRRQLTIALRRAPPRLRIPRWKGLGADSEEKHEPVSDVDTEVMDGLKALDPEGPIREADKRAVGLLLR